MKKKKKKKRKENGRGPIEQCVCFEPRGGMEKKKKKKKGKKMVEDHLSSGYALSHEVAR